MSHSSVDFAMPAHQRLHLWLIDSGAYRHYTGIDFPELKELEKPVPIGTAGPDSLMGVLWSKPIFDNRIRIVSLVLDVEAQNQNYGTEVLTELKSNAKSDGKHMIQLEVRKSNVKAQNFYSRHGLKIDKTIRDYYSNEDGLLMIGDL